MATLGTSPVMLFEVLAIYTPSKSRPPEYVAERVLAGQNLSEVAAAFVKASYPNVDSIGLARVER